MAIVVRGVVHGRDVGKAHAATTMKAPSMSAAKIGTTRARVRAAAALAWVAGLAGELVI